METTINSNATIWVTAVTVLEINSNRRYSALCNDSANVMYLSIGSTAEVWKWIRLNANWGSYEINRENLIRNSVSVIATGAWSNLSFITIE